MVDAPFRGASRNSNAAKHLRPEPRFAHGSNINSRDESCGKLKASGLCAKCLAAKSGPGERIRFCGESGRFNHSERRAIRAFIVCRRRHSYPRVDCTAFCRTVNRREDFPMSQNSTRSTRLEARLSPETLAVVKRAAEIEGRSVSDFVVAAARQAAQRTIAETQIIRLSVADQQTLAEALANPPKPAPALRRARAAHRRLILATK
jgi:uncharacterized protein (DUF1778 family)